VKYFIDTNILIDCFKKKTAALAKINEIAMQADSELFVNRLVYLESLRAIPLSDTRIFQQAKALFDMFDFVELNHDIYEQAIALSRYCQAQGITLKGRCAAIDFLHFATAKYYHLELLTYDGDMQKLAVIYQCWSASQA
jgi:predicted nucleic acid-binding protein